MDTIENLQSENEKLKKLNAFKSEVISMSAHELRTSLSATKWLLKMCVDGDLGALNGEQSKLLTKAFESNERMIALVNELLSINHTEESELIYDLTSTNIVEVISDVIFDFTGESFKRGIELIFIKPDQPLPEVYVDKNKIRFVIQNLIENGMKYSSKDGKLIISTHLTDTAVEVSVKDTGIGIGEEDKARIFEKFFRTDKARKTEEIGTGLGLFISKNIIERHKGTMWFESKEDQGTTFTFSLPITPKV